MRRPGSGPRDPGREWAEAALLPLKRARAEIDVAPKVMARLMASRPARSPASALDLRRLGFAWIASFAAGLAALGLLGLRLYGIAARREGLPESWAILRSLGRLGVTLVDALAGAMAALLAAAGPVLRGALALLHAAAPLLRGAGLAAAVCGALSIIVSLYIFAEARRTAPIMRLHDGIRQGGTR